jgi:hypothetical protein
MLTQTFKVADLVIDMVIAASKAREDGALTLSDALYFAPIISSIVPGVKGLSSVPVEILSEVESEDLIQEYIAEKLRGEIAEDEVLDDIVIHVFGVVVDLIYLADNIRGLKKK